MAGYEWNLADSSDSPHGGRKELAFLSYPFFSSCVLVLLHPQWLLQGEAPLLAGGAPSGVETECGAEM